MKYGSFKYGEAKYGATVDVGAGSITPSGSLSHLKVFLRDVGQGVVTITKNLSKQTNKTISASVDIVGGLSKLISKSTGQGIITPVGGSLMKAVSKKVGGAVLSPFASISKRITKKVGEGSISIVGGLSKLKFYFFVTADMILEPLGLLVTKINRSLMPPTRENTEEIPGRHGEIDFGTEFGSDMMELEVATDDGLTPEEVEALKRTLAGKLNPTIGERELVLAYEMDKSYKVKYAGRIPLDRYPTWMKFVIPFKLTNPMSDAIGEKVRVGSGTITNEGTFETGLVIEISGAATNPSLTIGGVTLAYTGTIATGQKLIIDTEKQTAKIGSTNAMAGYNGEFPLLQPGSVNVTAGSNVTIRWKDCWL